MKERKKEKKERKKRKVGRKKREKGKRKKHKRKILPTPAPKFPVWSALLKRDTSLGTSQFCLAAVKTDWGHSSLERFGWRRGAFWKSFNS